MTFDINSITTESNNYPPRIIFYGPEGIGKTLWASQSPKPIFIPTEDGAGKLKLASFPQVKTFDDVIKAMTTLLKEDHGYQTVVLDTMSRLEQIVHGEIREEHNTKKDGDVFASYGRGFKFVPPYFDRLIKGMNMLRQKGMMVLILGHSEIKKYESPDTATYDRYFLNCHEKIRDMMYQWCDAMLFAKYKIFTTTEQTAFNQVKARGTAGQCERVIYTEERATHHAKNRYELPYEISFTKTFDWNVFLDMVGTKPFEVTVPKPVVEATVET